MQIGRLSLTPALGVLYYDENFSDYYYGISESESRRSGLASYSAQDAWVPDVSLTAKYPIGEHVVLMASAGYSELPEEITDSPMIDRNESFTFVTGVSWRFNSPWMSVRLAYALAPTCMPIRRVKRRIRQCAPYVGCGASAIQPTDGNAFPHSPRSAFRLHPGWPS
ncbi:MipA/OmpV family protein [Escherichia coli]